MIKNIISSLLIVFLLAACKSSLKDDLINKVDEECGSKTNSGCTIILKDVTKFKWDKMYLFGSWTRSDTIAKVIRFKYEGDDVLDDYTRMLFTYSDRVVYEEDFESFDHYNSTLNFPRGSDSLSSEDFRSFTPSQAVFIAEKEKTKNSCNTCFYYSLIPAKRQTP
jgi:hypothetical protein